MKYRLKKLTLYIFIVTVMMLGAVPSYAEESLFEGAADPPNVTATSIMLMDAGSGEVLYEKDAYKKRDPASITKILNCLVCLDTLDFDQEVTVDIDPEEEGSTMRLKKGETMKIKDIVYGMMLWSANDGAKYLAYLAGDGSVSRFCDMMNEKAKELGAKDTAYVNPNGLNGEAVNNITTAYDIAIVVRAAMKDKRFREIVGTEDYVIDATNKSDKREMSNSNKCLWSDMVKAAANGDEEALDWYTSRFKSNPDNYDIGSDESEIRAKAERQANKRCALMYKPCIGVKTGYSSTAGDCFAGFARKGDTEIIAVVLNARNTTNRFKDAKKLWKYAFRTFETYTAQAKDDFKYQMKIKRGELREVDLGIEDDLKLTVLKKDDPAETVKVKVELTEEKPMAPIEMGEVVGRLVAYDNGKEVASQNLISLETSGEGSILSYIGFADEDMYQFFILLGVFIALIIAIIVICRTRSKKRKRP